MIGGLLSQCPWIITILGGYPLSIYTPNIYADGVTPFFLMVPVLVGVVGTSWILRNPTKYLRLLLIGVALAVLVWAIHFYFEADHLIHKFNWILSYCVVAVVVIAGVRFLLDLAVRKS